MLFRSVGFIFYPRCKNQPRIILELKTGSTPDAAILQIKEKEHCEKLKNENVSQILAVGINYDIKKRASARD